MASVHNQLDEPHPSPGDAVIGRNNKVTPRTRIAFSTGALEEAAVGAAGIATMLFYNQVLGLYGFDLSTEEMSIQRFFMIPGMFVALPLAAWLTRKLDKKRTVIYSSIVGATLIGLPHAL